MDEKYLYVLLLVVGLIFISSYSFLNEYESSTKPYVFSFEVQAEGTKPHFNYFVISHDFSTNKGNISFLAPKDKLQVIDIFFPVIIKDNKTINVSTKNCGNYYPRNYSNCIGVKNQTFKKGLYLSTNPYKGLSRTFLRLEDFNRTFTNDERIFIFYEMTITPNSHYTFELYNDLSSSVYDLETVDFYLGNNFFCNGICVSLTSDDFYESSAGSSQEIKLVSIDNETDFRKNFKIVGVIKKTKWLIKNAFFAIGASILASIIVLFFQ